jgi:hypothetical protein
MATESTNKPQTITFAFPFRDVLKKEIMDEHVFHAWLANEGNGNFTISRSGMWHGGIHVSADGAGKQFDLEHGVRCMADGEVVAYRVNRTYPVSEIPAQNGQPAVSAPYSTGFALVRHSMEFPKGTTLTFFADSDNDASLPEMARFMRPDTGLIAQFVTTQLAGVIERQGDHWVLAQGANRSALTVDPAFLTALNKLMRVSTVLFPSGDAHVRYELRAVPTPGVTDMKLLLSGRALHYFNQKEEWTPFVWPGDTLENLSHIEWQTAQGGLRSALDTQGRFGLIRLLERATVTPQDSARYLLSWTPDQSQGIPLRV